MSESKGRVEGKVAIVTGAASGLGAAAARRLAAEGASVMLTDIAADAGRAVADQIAGAGGVAEFTRHDAASEEDWAGVMAATVERFGRLTVLVNNAGIAELQPLMTHEYAAWRRVMSVNLDGVFLGLRHAGPAIAEAGGGSVINISSIMGKVGFPGGAAYCASKGGVALLTKAAALEWAPLGIRVNSVHPGFVETPMVTAVMPLMGNVNEVRDLLVSRHALGRLGAPSEIGDAVLFLASDESSFMTGSELVVDGGYTAQ
jgi:NAD(P)-dependent dehydrogenase (short-subunit alcohol dehydrogenase family)